MYEGHIWVRGVVVLAIQTVRVHKPAKLRVFFLAAASLKR